MPIFDKPEGFAAKFLSRKESLFKQSNLFDGSKKEKEKELGRELTRSEIDDLFSQLNPNNPDKD